MEKLQPKKNVLIDIEKAISLIKLSGCCQEEMAGGLCPHWPPCSSAPSCSPQFIILSHLPSKNMKSLVTNHRYAATRANMEPMARKREGRLGGEEGMVGGAGWGWGGGAVGERRQGPFKNSSTVTSSHCATATVNTIHLMRPQMRVSRRWHRICDMSVFFFLDGGGWHEGVQSRGRVGR